MQAVMPVTPQETGGSPPLKILPQSARVGPLLRLGNRWMGRVPAGHSLRGSPAGLSRAARPTGASRLRRDRGHSGAGPAGADGPPPPGWCWRGSPRARRGGAHAHSQPKSGLRPSEPKDHCPWEYKGGQRGERKTEKQGGLTSIAVGPGSLSEGRPGSQPRGGRSLGTAASLGWGGGGEGESQQEGSPRRRGETEGVGPPEARREAPTPKPGSLGLSNPASAPGVFGVFEGTER